MSYQVQVGGNALGLNVVFCSPWMQDWIICLSKGAEILSYKQTLQGHALVYHTVPAGVEWRVGSTDRLRTLANRSTDPLSALILCLFQVSPSSSRLFIIIFIYLICALVDQTFTNYI